MNIVAFGNDGRFTGMWISCGVLEVVDRPERHSNLSPLVGVFESEFEALDFLTENYPESFEDSDEIEY